MTKDISMINTSSCARVWQSMMKHVSERMRMGGVRGEQGLPFRVQMHPEDFQRRSHCGVTWMLKSIYLTFEPSYLTLRYTFWIHVAFLLIHLSPPLTKLTRTRSLHFGVSVYLWTRLQSAWSAPGVLVRFFPTPIRLSGFISLPPMIRLYALFDIWS